MIDSNPISLEKAQRKIPSPLSVKIYKMVKDNYDKGMATEIIASKNHWSACRNHLIDMAEADGLVLFTNTTDNHRVRNYWMEKPE